MVRWFRRGAPTQMPPVEVVRDATQFRDSDRQAAWDNQLLKLIAKEIMPELARQFSAIQRGQHRRLQWIKVGDRERVQIASLGGPNVYVYSNYLRLLELLAQHLRQVHRYHCRIESTTSCPHATPGRNTCFKCQRKSKGIGSSYNYIMTISAAL
jgi:hypothetical protein